jgi:hypothetical protein
MLRRVATSNQTRPKRNLSGIALGLFVLFAGSPSLAQSSNDYRCANGDDIRRIEIRFEDENGRLPCRVIYRPETETDKVGIVSWRGLPDRASCDAQAGEVVDRLTNEGWICSADETIDAAVANEAGLQGSEAPDPGLEEVVAQRSLPSSLGLSVDVDAPARLVNNPGLPTPPAGLADTVRRDLDQLDTTLDGQLEGKVVGYGDLDGDDLEDALVLYTYTSPQPASREFLVAYMFDGQTYQMRATKPVGGNINGTMGAKVEAIDRGVIHLSLRAYEPGDPACCPTGVHNMAIVLRELDLVEVDLEAPTR